MMRVIIPAFLFFSLLLMSCNGNKTVNKPISDKPAVDTSTQNNSEPPPNPYAPIDISPMDMSYFPVDYPKLKMAHSISTAPLARVVYSRPHLQGRHLFHEVLKYGEAWRLGANEATELQLFKDVSIQGKKVAAGRYVLYCVPQQDKWTIVLNANLDSWGLTQDSTKDVARFDTPVIRNQNHLEYLTIMFEKISTGANLVMAWDDAEAKLPISF
jgi:hypothetical protein